MMSTSKQRQTIGFLRKLLKLDDDIYREMLHLYNVQSSKNLSYKEADEIINNLKQKAIELKLYTPKLKYEHFICKTRLCNTETIKDVRSSVERSFQ